jgi:exopolysaccharide biosynthesis protein
VTNWREVENVSPTTFLDVRHPRTLIGVDRRGFIWLVAVDGRQPGYSLGMTFAELMTLANRLELRDALNLDGGGSTTMWVKGVVVNKPSDPAGARAVSDALIVR